MPMLETLPDADMFRTTKAVADPDLLRVDRKNHIIYGASLMQVGDLNDSRPWTVDAETLQQAEHFANQSKGGMKARYTHPNMSNDGMGSYLGRWRNVTVDGDTLRGDLHIAESAFNSPNGDLATYVMDLADEDPEAFGVSLAPRLDSKAMEKLEAKDKRTPIRFSALRAADIVDEPAATRGGLFSIEKVDLRLLPFQATMLLDAYFGDAEPSVIEGRVSSFLAKYLRTKGHDMSTETAPAEATEEVTTTETTDTALAEQPETVTTTEPAQPEAPVVTGTQELSAVDIERQRIKQIKVLCDIAKCSSKFADFIDSGLSVDDVKFALKELAPKQNPALSEQDEVEKPKQSPDEKFAQEYRDAVKAGHKFLSTEAEYVRSRRIDEGLETLEPGKAG